MSIIMFFFPFLGEKKTVSNEEVAEAVIYAVENKDASALEAVMCKNIKDNHDNLTEEINKMLSCIEGDIDNITWERYGGYYENDGNGKSVTQNNQQYKIITSKGVYGIAVVVETDNSFSTDELGIRSIGLFTLVKDDDSNITNQFIYGETLYKIFATEGVKEWHD